MTAPIQIIDNFLLQYHIGHVLALALLGHVGLSLVLRDWRVFAAGVLSIGIILVATPASVLGATPLLFKMAGVVLIVLGPLVYTVVGG